MNFKKFSLLGLLIGTVGISQAQYLEDGIRFSQTDIGTSARFGAMGGAQTALGGDLSSIAGNPAGLGFYNNSDASFSLSFQNDLNQSSYFGTKTNRNSNKFNLDQAAVLIHMPVRKRYGQNLQTGWLNFNVGVSFNRTQDFQSKIYFSGENDISSYTDMLADFTDDPVYDSWGKGSNFIRNNGSYPYPTTSEQLTNMQDNKDIRKGSQHQTNISFGANYGNQFYIGTSLGIAGFRYESNRTFAEVGAMKDASEFTQIDPNVDFLRPGSATYPFLDQDYELQFSGFQVTKGTGVNATLGMIFLPHRMWRIGLSATTPTWYRVKDHYTMFFDGWMVDKNTNADLFNYASPEENYYDEYNLRTPYRLNAGLAVLFEEGLISADVEFVDYTSMRISRPRGSGGYDFNKIQQIKDLKEFYQSAFNFRVGGEYKLSEELLLRGGYNFQGSPYKDYNSNRQMVTAGLGYRVNNVYVDMAYQNQLYKYHYQPYQSYVNPTESAKIENRRNRVLLTVGVKF